MRVLFAVFSLLAVAALARFRDADNRDSRFRYDEVDEREVQPFRAGQTFRYRLDHQLSNGMASASDQHGVTRLRAEAMLHFESERKVVLRLNDITVGTLNREIPQPERVQPMSMFKNSPMKPEETRLLELPCTFDYSEGLVELIKFHSNDKSWSKNIKKSVLNMIQLNLKQRQGEKVELDERTEWKRERELLETSNMEMKEKNAKTFVMPEITLEGECQVTYTLNKMLPRNQFNMYEDDRRSDSDNLRLFNVTKSIDFHRCQKIADIRYGPKIEKPCENCTNERELEERKLDRTTILRHIVVGTPEKYGIKKVELVSHYQFKMLNVEEETPMHTVVAGELSYIRIEEGKRIDERELRQVETNDQAETLLYNTEWDEDEKRFYMYGDEEFPNTTPFEKVSDKVTKIESAMKKLITLWSTNKQEGIETEATMAYSRLVELLRMCSMKDLENVYSRRESFRSETEQIKAEDVLIDALSNAGTHNTIKFLLEKVRKQDVEISRIVRALFQLKGIPAPSEKIVKTVEQFCESDMCRRSEACKQVCWLTTGSLMGELCDEEITVEDALEQKKSLCQTNTKKEFVKNIMQKFEKAESRYEKILYLKALGNAGLDKMVYELEKVIRDVREEPLVRMQAIDALRRLRAVMPFKIQRILMPVFQNVRERPEVRMQAISMILTTIPERPILDQIGLTLMRDPSLQVKSFVYGVMKQYAESPISVEKDLSRHLKALLKLADINDEDEEVMLRGSRYYRIPIYSQAKKEGFFVDLESMVGSDNILPKHLSVGVDNFFNGLFQKNGLELNMNQEDIEQWIEKMLDVYMDYYYGDLASQKSSRGYRSSGRDNSESDRDFRQLIKEMSIKRRSSVSTRRIDSDHNNENNSPYGMLTFRYGDFDYVILPLEEETLPRSLKKIFVDGQRPQLRDFENTYEYLNGKPWRMQAALHILENSIKIPTSTGFPIRMWHVVPVLTSCEGQIKIRNGQEAEFKLRKTFAITHLKRVEVWSPIVNTGVETSRTMTANIPLEGKVEFRDTLKVRLTIPERAMRLITIQTLPLTFVTDIEYLQPRTPIVRRLENQQLMHRLQHIDTVVGRRDFGMPLRLTGEIHTPHRWTYGDLIRLCMTTENHFHVDFEPTEETPREVVLTIIGGMFRRMEDDERRSDDWSHKGLKDFYSKSKFDDEMDQYYEQEDDEDRKFNKYVEDYEPSRMFNHFVELRLETVGGRKQKNAQMKIQAACDPEHRYMSAKINIERSPLECLDESRQWTGKAKVTAMLPESVNTIEQYREGRRDDKQQKLVCDVDTEWGSDKRQTIRMRINGEQARNPEWREKINEIEKYNPSTQSKLREQMVRKVAFLNKYDMSVEYKVEPSTKNFFYQLTTLLKGWNFWNTRTELKSTGRDQREGEIRATVVIDPFTHEHLNVSIKTPQENIRIDSMQMPMKVKFFKLYRPEQYQKNFESVHDYASSYIREYSAECKVDSRNVRTFDNVIFKAPLTKCYSVLAKDCSNTQEPRFAVMMRKIEGEDKELQMIIKGNKIEIRLMDDRRDELQVKINGKRVNPREDYDLLREYGIDYDSEMVHINTKDVSVRFDGKRAWVKLSQFYKQEQCGLCGHYDDDTDDEFRMPNDELTRDLKSYHKSYTWQNEDCKRDMEETHNREEYRPLYESREYYEPEEEYQRRRERINNENYETETVEKTEVMEYNHKICFSVKSVKACPEGAYPDKTKDMKVGFTCLDRTSTDARRMLREVRRYENGPVEIPRQHREKPSFVETITVPSTCIVY